MSVSALRHYRSHLEARSGNQRPRPRSGRTVEHDRRLSKDVRSRKPSTRRASRWRTCRSTHRPRTRRGLLFLVRRHRTRGARARTRQRTHPPRVTQGSPPWLHDHHTRVDEDGRDSLQQPRLQPIRAIRHVGTTNTTMRTHHRFRTPNGSPPYTVSAPPPHEERASGSAVGSARLAGQHRYRRACRAAKAGQRRRPSACLANRQAGLRTSALIAHDPRQSRHVHEAPDCGGWSGSGVLSPTARVDNRGGDRALSRGGGSGAPSWRSRESRRARAATRR